MTSNKNNDVNVLVLGAAGVVGFGICDAWLREGATVYAVDSREDALEGLSVKLGLEQAKTNLFTILGDFSSEEAAKATKEVVLTRLDSNGNGKSLHHIITALGCSSPAPDGTDMGAPGAFQRMKETYEQVLFPNILATNLFLDEVRNVQGATFTVAGGPFTHHCPSPELYSVSMMGASLNHFGTILKHQTQEYPCRGNTLCCHFAIGFPDETVSNFGPLLDKDFGPISDCRRWGKAFVRVAKGTERLGFICMHDPEEVDVLIDSKEWIWFPDKHKFGPAP